MKLYLTQPTSTEYYGGETTEEEAEVVARNCLDLAMAYAEREYPNAEIDGTLVQETVSYNNRSWADDDEYDDGKDPTAHPAIEDVLGYVGGHLQEDPLWTEEFDADAYLAANPR